METFYELTPTEADKLQKLATAEYDFFAAKLKNGNYIVDNKTYDKFVKEIKVEPQPVSTDKTIDKYLKIDTIKK